jgi:hypothetical protein
MVEEVCYGSLLGGGGEEGYELRNSTVGTHLISPHPTRHHRRRKTVSVLLARGQETAKSALRPVLLATHDVIPCNS